MANYEQVTQYDKQVRLDNAKCEFEKALQLSTIQVSTLRKRVKCFECDGLQRTTDTAQLTKQRAQRSTKTIAFSSYSRHKYKNTGKRTAPRGEHQITKANVAVTCH